MEAEDAGNEQKPQFYERLVDHHQNKVAQYVEEIAAMKEAAKVCNRSTVDDQASTSSKKRRTSPN
jgi:hypothetical protein